MHHITIVLRREAQSVVRCNNPVPGGGMIDNVIDKLKLVALVSWQRLSTCGRTPDPLVFRTAKVISAGRCALDRRH